MTVHIPDDWFDTLRGVPCFRLLDGHEVTVRTDAAPGEATLAAHLAGADCVVRSRERTRLTPGLL
ncbi:glyoxylate reductase [Citreicella sp. SE45]|nr:glyoxylate reductase [Citreicella sp. SE45]